MTCDQDRTLHLAANEAGNGLLRYIPALGAASQPNDVYGYLHAEDGYVRAVADFCGVPPETVTAIGSALQYLDNVAHFSSATDIVVLEKDFRGYSLVARRRGLAVVAVPAGTGDDEGIYERLAMTVRMLRHPVVFLTIGITNPLQTRADAERAVAAIRAANPRAVVVLDSAYADYCGIGAAQLARLAVEIPGVIMVNPCSKSHFIAGGAVGWMVTGDAVLDRFARADDFPFRAPGAGCRAMMRLLDMPACIERARTYVCEARDMNAATVTRYGGADNVIAGEGPWVLWNAHDNADEIVHELKAHRVLVQQQSGSGDALASNWIRISATVPDESELFAFRLDRAMALVSAVHSRS